MRSISGSEATAAPPADALRTEIQLSGRNREYLASKAANHPKASVSKRRIASEEPTVTQRHVVPRAMNRNSRPPSVRDS